MSTPYTLRHVPAPEQAPTVLIPSPQASGTIYGNPLGVYDIAMTLLDYDGRHTAMSPHITHSFTHHWLLVSIPPILPPFHEAACYCLWWRDSSKAAKWRPLGGQQFCQSPYLPFTGFTNHYLRGHMVWRTAINHPYDSHHWDKGAQLSDGSLMAAPPFPPLFYVMQPPKQGLLGRWRWLVGSSNGISMTEPSPVVEIPPAASDERYVIKLALHDEPVNGCLARMLELKDPNQSAQWVAAGTYPLHANMINIHDFPVNMHGQLTDFTQMIPVNDMAILHPVQAAINPDSNTFSDVVITEDVVTLHSPLVNPYRPVHFGRTIGKANGGRWKLVANHIGPAFLECNQDTRLVGCMIKSDTASAGVDFCDTTGQGGGAYAFRSERLTIDLNLNLDSYGIGVMDESGSVQRGHTSSEAVFDDTAINAHHPIIIEGKQSVNWLFRLLDIWAGYLTHSTGMTSAIVLNNNNDVRVLDKLVVDSVRTLLSVPGGRAAMLEGVYIDQCIPQWIVTGNAQSPDVRIDWTSGQNQHMRIQGVTVDTSPDDYSSIYKPSGTENNNLPKKYFYGN